MYRPNLFLSCALLLAAVSSVTLSAQAAVTLSGRLINSLSGDPIPDGSLSELHGLRRYYLEVRVEELRPPRVTADGTTEPVPSVSRQEPTATDALRGRITAEAPRIQWVDRMRDAEVALSVSTIIWIDTKGQRTVHTYATLLRFGDSPGLRRVMHLGPMDGEAERHLVHIAQQFISAYLDANAPGASPR